MTNQQSYVLYHLQHGNHYGDTTSSIEHLTGYPQPAIRRTIQELRRLGYNISFGSGVYRYRSLKIPVPGAATEQS